MIDSKLWKLCQSLSTKEIHQLDKFLRSPYFNKRSDVIDLFAFLIKCRPADLSDEEQVFRSIWPSKSFCKKDLTYTMSFLVDLILQYFAHEQLKGNRIKKLQAYAEVVHGRRLDAAFKTTSNKLARTIREMPESTTKYKLLHETMQLAKENFYRKDQFDEISLDLVNLSLDEYYFLEKLRIYIEAESLASRQADTFSDPLRPSILSLIHENKNRLSPLIRLYLSVYEAVTGDGKIDSLRMARKLLRSIEADIAQQHLKELYLLTINYGIKQMNRGSEPFFRETFQLYQGGLHNGALLENGILSSSTYKNITAVGLRLHEYSWVSEFLINYKHVLHPKNRAQDFKYNRSIYHFATKNYDAFATLAAQLKSRNVHINCDLRRMYAIMFYEQGDFDVLEHHLKSFKAYLIRHRGRLSYHFRNWNQFILTMSRLTKALDNQTDKLQLYAEIQEMEYLSSKNWFLEQIEVQKSDAL